MAQKFTPAYREEEFASGNTYGYIVPNVLTMLHAGFFPQPIVPLVRRSQKDLIGFVTDEPSEETEKAYEEFRCRLVARMLRTINGKPVQLQTSSSSEDWKALLDDEQWPQDDVEALFGRALRLGAAPKVKALTNGR